MGKKKKETEQIRVERNVGLYQIKAQYQGLVPMMHDRFFNPEEVGPGGRRRKKGQETWKDELIKKAYIDSKGAYVPADNIRMMLIGNKPRPGAVKIQGSMFESQKGTEYKTMAQGAIWVVGPEDPLKVYLEPRRLTYDNYDERSFVNPKTGRGITRRPIFKTPWLLSFIIQVTDSRLTADFVRALFDTAGLYCGCGAYGPTFGRCVISEWEVLK